MRFTRPLHIPILVAAATAACSANSSGDPATGPKFADGDTAYCLTLGADYTNGVSVLSAVALPSLTVTQDLLKGAAGNDPVIRTYNNKIYIVNRTTAAITVIDKATFTVDRQFSTGDNSNPQDVAVIGISLYVVTLGTGSIQVWNLNDKTATAPASTIDISSFDSDGLPDAGSIYIVGEQAFVTLGLLDETDPNFPAKGNGKVVVIDLTKNTVADDFDLSSPNPLNFIRPSGGDLLVETAGDFSGTEGCVETLHTGSSAGLGDCLVDNAEVNGTVAAIAVSGSTTYLAVSASDFTHGSLRSVNNGTLSATLTPDTEVVSDLGLAPNGLLVYADSAAGGIRVWDTGKNMEVTASALDIGLPPAFVDGIACLSR